jgi:glycosyltransferase involved in cell wall biosynthesis
MQILAVGATYGGVADVFRRVLAELRRTGSTVQELRLPELRAPAWSGIVGAICARRHLRSAEVVHVEFGSNDTAVFWFAMAALLLRRDCVVVAHDYPKVINHPAAGLVSTRSRAGRFVAYRVLSPLLDGSVVTWLVRRSGVIVVFGSEAREGWHSKGARRVHEIAHGADVSADGDTPPPSRGEMVLFAGFMGPSKGVDVLLRAWAMIGCTAGLPLALAGRAYEPWFGETVSPYLIGPNAPRVLGEIDDEEDFQRLIGRAAVVVLPYRYSSPASGILTRAMGAGRPVVVTPVPAMKVIIDGENGAVVPIDDHVALAAALGRLCASPLERDRLGSAARSTARQRFTWDSHVAGLRTAYDLARDRRTC